jgi:hypothetical protein
MINVAITAARSAPRSEPANSHDFRPRTISRHSAHIGQDVMVRYRWHPLYGRRVRRIQSERRASGELVHVELTPDAVTILPAWKLDTSAHRRSPWRRSAHCASCSSPANHG